MIHETVYPVAGTGVQVTRITDDTDDLELINLAIDDGAADIDLTVDDAGLLAQALLKAIGY
ncbi:hypothetical protein QP905_08215 [Corynebacterium pseudodiphtheriticum]|uniref:hypothetical protein n=1 Tax=Corynebacterium TaxID=1716 RepID=UPI0020534CE2|nr:MULTISPECIES: hypothetical protein [Corynebacterium]MDK4244092.1 hypothetical protein [Corynebacterium pseudodiphtheriticum]MDK4258468.1 hypothetical protein [Corynebacterium propinquum]MDK8578329.1 hypothetical protein [Corynebacterium pseudodiphtheriticum]DAU74273.1 MAG TPA: hypothetical protein [Caudoviricetes sp.]